jgi:serine/threonine protein kinase
MSRERMRTNMLGRKVEGKKGKYEINSHVAQGGFGEVWLATTGEGKPVAVKTLLEKFETDEEKVKSFFVEGILQQSLDHKFVVASHEVAMDKDKGIPFIVMERMMYNLNRFIPRNGTASKSQLTDTQAIHVVLRAAEALHYVHQQGIIHCDFHPGNILFNAEGRLRLTDFGIARITNETLRKKVEREMKKFGFEGSIRDTELDEDIDLSNLSITKTRQARFVGTERYTAPEVRAGGIPNVASDIYSLSSTAYELFKVLQVRALRDVVSSGTHFDPDERMSSYSTAEKFAQSLQKVPDHYRQILAYKTDKRFDQGTLDDFIEVAEKARVEYTGSVERLRVSVEEVIEDQEKHWETEVGRYEAALRSNPNVPTLKNLKEETDFFLQRICVGLRKVSKMYEG